MKIGRLVMNNDGWVRKVVIWCALEELFTPSAKVVSCKEHPTS